MPNDPVALVQFAIPAVILLAVAAVVIEKTVRHPGFVTGALFVARGFLPAVASTVGVFMGDLGVSAIWVWLGRLGTLVGLLAAGVALVKMERSPLRHGGAELFVAALAFAGSAAFSELVNDFTAQQRTVMAAAAFLTVGLARLDPEWLIRLGKAVLALYVVGSVAAVLLNAPLAWAPYDQAPLLGFDARLRGVATHPNVLGPLMLLYLILERLRPSEPLIRLLMSGAALVLLLLAQSKTAWAAAILILLIHWAGDPRRKRAAQVLVGAIAVALTALAMTVGELSPPDLVSPEQVENARTLTGRTTVWEFGLESWRSAPVFGAGPMVFHEYAERTGQGWAGQAHNQYVHTLARHGLVGLAGLLFYVFVLVKVAFRHAAATRYASVSLVSLLLLRSTTEANLDGLFFEHLLTFALLMAWERVRQEQDARRISSRRRT